MEKIVYLISFLMKVSTGASDAIVFPDGGTTLSDPHSDPRLSPPINPSINPLLLDTTPLLGSEFRAPPSLEKSSQICRSPFGFFPHERNCRKFYQCSWSKAYVKICPFKTVWNDKERYCDWPFNVDCNTDKFPSSSKRPPVTRPTTARPVTSTTSRPKPPQPLPPNPSPSDCSGTICGVSSSEPITAQIRKIRQSTSCTLENKKVEAIYPGAPTNPQNVKNVEAIFPESKFNEFFPKKNAAYTYTNFLKAVGKYPSICAKAATCPKILANMFAHFEQETAGLYYIEEINKGSYCADWSDWVKKAYPCIPGRKYFGRGAKQLSWNYNYGAFSSAMYGDPLVLLREPERVANTWLNFAASMWFFVTPQPPKPSMLEVLDGSWTPNAHDSASNLKPGFGVTTMIINGGIECGRFTQQAQNRAKYYREYARKMGVSIAGEKLDCSDMKQFSFDGSAGKLALYWAPESNCKLVTWQTAYSALVEGDYNRCKGLPSKCGLRSVVRV